MCSTYSAEEIYYVLRKSFGILPAGAPLAEVLQTCHGCNPFEFYRILIAGFCSSKEAALLISDEFRGGLWESMG